MPATTTTLFSKSDVEALMIIGGKEPRFEVTLRGAVKQRFPATQAWRKEQKAAVEAAQALLAAQPIMRAAEVLGHLDLPILADGEQPTKKRATLKLVAEGEGVRIIVQGGPNASARADLRVEARTALEAIDGWTVDLVQDGLVATPGASFTPVAEEAAPAVDAEPVTAA